MRKRHHSPVARVGRAEHGRTWVAYHCSCGYRTPESQHLWVAVRQIDKHGRVAS